MTDRKEADEKGQMAADPRTFRIATATAVILSAAVIVASVTVAVSVYHEAAKLLSVKISGSIGAVCLALIWGMWGLVIIASDSKNSLKKNRELDE